MHGRKKFAAKTAGRPSENTKGSVPDAVLKQARKSGQLNLSNRELKTVPDKIWKINLEIPEEERNASLDTDEKWWDQTELNKLILASNQITNISPDIQLLQGLLVLDVSLFVFYNACRGSFSQGKALVVLNFLFFDERGIET